MHVGIANWQNLGYQQITDLDPAVGLDVPEGARFAILVAEAQHVRWRDDGDDPTTAIGMLLKTTDQPFLYAGEGRGHARERRAGVLVHLEVLAAGVLGDLLEADLERVPVGLGDVEAEDGRARLFEGGAGLPVFVVENDGPAPELAEAVAEEKDRLRPGKGLQGPAERQQGLLRGGRRLRLLAVEVLGERRGLRGLHPARPPLEDRLVEDAGHRLEVGCEIEVQP